MTRIKRSQNSSLTAYRVVVIMARAISGVTCLVSKDAGVAQLVEQRFRKPQVARSIRVAGSKPCLRVPCACTIQRSAASSN